MRCAGRRAEFAEAYEAFGDDVPDPLAVGDVRSADAGVGRAANTRGPRHALVKRTVDEFAATKSCRILPTRHSARRELRRAMP